MSLSSAIQKGVNAAFKAAGDVRIVVTINTPTGAYDPVTDSYSTSPALTQIVTHAIISKFSEYEIAEAHGDIRMNDIKLIVNNDDLQYDVTFNSEFVIDGLKYRIVNPANTTRSAQGVIQNAGWFVSIFQLRAL